MRLTTIRLLPVLLLGLSLAVAGAAQPLAGANGRVPPGVTEVALCASEAGRTILIDASGAPVEPEPSCPCAPCSDCLAAAEAAPAAAPARLPGPAPRWRAAEPDRGTTAPAAFLLTPNARGPPSLRT